MTRTACNYPGQEIDAGAVQAWLELELARLKLAARNLVEAYFREGREQAYSQKIWPRLKEYNGRSFYVIWCRKDYVNPKRGIVRTQHISRGQGSYRRRLAQVCQNLGGEEKSFVLDYEERFRAIRQASELLVNMLVQLGRYQKEQKNLLFGNGSGGGSC